MKVSNDVLKVLSQSTTNGNALVLPYNLERNMYTQVNKVLEASGGKWNKKAKAHLFDIDASDRIEQIILTGEVEIPKDEFNYFPTPNTVVDRLMELAEIEKGMEVLEPSAGQGAIADACVKAGACVDCVELMEANYKVLLSKGYAVFTGDFLTMEPVLKYDRVVMNPPFLKQNDIKHVTHAMKFLKPNGILVAVMASSVTFRDNKLTTDFRAMVEANGGIIEELPTGSFKSSGTMVNTVIVKMIKKG